MSAGASPVAGRGRGLRWAAVAAVGASALVVWALGAQDGAPTAARADASRAVPLLGAIDVADSLGAVVAASGSVWAHDRQRGRLLRLDGRTGRVVARVPVHGRATLAAGAGSLWALRAGRGHGDASLGPLLRIDPATNRVVARIRARPPDGRWTLVFGALAHRESAWIWGPSDLLRVDLRRNRVVASVPVDSGAGEVTGATLTGDVLVVVTADGRLLRYDAATGDPLGSARVPLEPTDLADAGAAGVAVIAGGTLAVADPATGRVRWRRDLGYRIGGVARTGGLLWAHTSPQARPRDALLGLDPRTGRTVARTGLDALGTTGVVVLAGRLWLATIDGRVLVLRP